MADLFDNTILCKDCKVAMKKADVLRNGFVMRSLKCDSCPNVILHPDDVREFDNFKQLQSKQFRVKLRIVGNSYAVSIPREIVDFMHAREKVAVSKLLPRKKVEDEMRDMVNLCFEEMGRISLHF
ncbi:MAG: hypothetical protein ACI83O_000234 [Patescibacteria group bacterium]|jgi:hypothetical protein